MNDLRFHIPIRYEIKILSTTEIKFHVKWYFLNSPLSSKIANK